MKVLLFGGTGHLGRDVIREALPQGLSMRVASRRSRSDKHSEAVQWAQADLATGQGLKESVEGVQTIIFAAGNPKNHAEVEVEGMKRLLSAARQADVRHLILISIVGIDRIPVPYYRTKLAAERVVRDGGVPYSILRATQFHYLVDFLLRGLARVPFVLPIPRGFVVQPVATEDVAARLLRCVVEGPGGMLKDFCGPEILRLQDVAAQWKQARHIHKPVIEVPVPGQAGAAFRHGSNTNREGDAGSMRWDQWLAREYPPGQHPD